MRGKVMSDSKRRWTMDNRGKANSAKEYLVIYAAPPPKKNHKGLPSLPGVLNFQTELAVRGKPWGCFPSQQGSRMLCSAQ